MKPKHTVSFYQSRNTKLWHWRITHANGNIIANWGEGYARRIDARNALRNLLRSADGLLGQITSQ